MTFLDLFAGIGGFRRGLERSGHTCIGHVEIDKYANRSYMAMYGLEYCQYEYDDTANSCRMCKPEVRKNCDGKTCRGEWYAKDIEQITAGEIPEAEIWTFGFPCTDISLSGKRAGLAGKRSGLFFTVIGLLKGKDPKDRPGVLVIENVKHLLSSQRGGDFTTVLFELWQAGYNTEWMCVNSRDFGVPQHRERVYLVGHLGNRCAGKVFPLPGTNAATVKRVIDGRQGSRVYDPSGLSVTLTANGGGVGGRTGLYTVSVSRNQEQNAAVEPMPRCAGFIDLNEAGAITAYARCVKAKQNAGVVNHRGESSGIFLCQGHPDCVRAVITPEREHKRQNGRRIKADGEPGYTLTCQDRQGVLLCCCNAWKDGGLPIREGKKVGFTTASHGDGINLIRSGNGSRRGRVGKQCAQTLLTDGNMGVLLCCRIRRLTPRECWRLQAFEDELFDRARAAGLSDAQLYKQAGNAVTVNIVYEIGRRLNGGRHEV